ncbi:MAG: preprotein translocase subunit SecA [Planctomycetota bacterium]|nr:preprotein translocase subunit SecA [Planctomycetota bacterium]
MIEMDWDSISDKLSVFGDRLGRSLKGAFGSRNERVVRTLEPLVAEINARESWAQGLAAEAFAGETERLRALVAGGETTLDEVLPEAFALAREASVRTLGLRPFDVQLVGGIVLHQGAIAEMTTGEGKTLVATLPLYLNALTGRTCYLVTVNDYLARRDADWMRPIFEFLGLSVGAIQSSMSPWDRQPVYACDIVYGTNNEFGFDYLRDNMKTRVEDQVQKQLYFAIVDEVDSILIDEARTPLIISGPAEEGSDKYKLSDTIARKLIPEEHYEVKEKERSASLLEPGIEVAQSMVGVESFYTPGNEDWPHYIENALRAHALYRQEKEYVVENGEVIIVDEFTGRKMQGRRWSDGLHQAVEVKEGLTPRQENQTLATITYQNYFRMFDKLGGMTGTALTEAGEFHKIYELDVVSIPTNLPIAREDGLDVVYRTEREKWHAIVEEIGRLRERGQPVLVGTTSVEKSEKLSGMLKRRGIEHSVLNAKVGQWEREANIVSLAGDRGSVTVATNMAGRGTDIKLGGNFEYRLGKALEEAGLEEGDVERLAEIDTIREDVRTRCEADEQEVLELGGLYVLGTERHEARRIDNQLRGRSGRQGNAGESRFFLSLEDDLMRIFYSERTKNLMERLGMSEGQQIESGMVTRAIAKAQKKVEDRNFEIRKHLLEYDEVMDVQRKEIYGVRQDVLAGIETKDKVLEMLQRVIDRACVTFADDASGLEGWVQRTFGFEPEPSIAAQAADADDGTTEPLIEEVARRYEQREAEVGEELMRRIEGYVLLNAIDSKWKDHLHAVDALKAGIGLRGYAQVDPKNEYKREGFQLFDRLFEAVEDEVVSLILRIRVQTDGEGEGAAGSSQLAPRGMVSGSAAGAGGGRRPPTGGIPASRAFDLMRRRQLMDRAARERSEEDPATSPPREPAGAPEPPPEIAGDKVGRNDPCPCGSGKKYKKCHGSGRG